MDDWRRSNKKSINENLSDSSAFIDKKEEGFSDKKSEKYYLDQLPTTKEQLEKSDNKIINAYYQASVIYNEDLDEKIKSDDMLTQLIGRFPFNNEFTPLAYYSLYLTKIESKKEEEATQIKNLLIKYFPKSNYAKMVLDSNFIKNIQKIYSSYNINLHLITNNNSIINIDTIEAKDLGQFEIKGKKKYGGPHYRLLKKQYQKENNGNWVILALYPYDPFEDVMSEKDEEFTDNNSNGKWGSGEFFVDENDNIYIYTTYPSLADGMYYSIDNAESWISLPIPDYYVVDILVNE